MPDPFEQRYGDHLEDSKNKKKLLSVGIFAPYGGACSYILEAIEYRLRERDNYNVWLCSNRNFDFLRNTANTSAEYNWMASEEGLEEADRAVFILFKSIRNRFDDAKYNPRFEINSSVLMEFEHWVSNHDHRGEKLLVLYEQDQRTNFGSLLEGRISSSDIHSRDIEPTEWAKRNGRTGIPYREATIESFREAIAAQVWNWVDEYESTLHR